MKSCETPHDLHVKINFSFQHELSLDEHDHLKNNDTLITYEMF